MFYGTTRMVFKEICILSDFFVDFLFLPTYNRKRLRSSTSKELYFLKGGNMKKIFLVLLFVLIASFVFASGTQEPATGKNATAETTTSTQEPAKEAAEEVEEDVKYGPKIGVTLFTLRHKYIEIRDAALAAGKSNQEAATEAVTTILRKIADMGYQGYQINWQDPNWFDMPASELKALNEELGLTMISPHWMTAWYCDEEQLEWIINYCVEAGATGISLDVNHPSSVVENYSGMPLTATMMDKWVKYVINQIHYMQDKIEEMGYSDVLKVGMHTHSLEWIPVETYGNRYFIDILYSEFGDSVDLHFDTSHAVYPNFGWDAIYPETHILGVDGLVKYMWQHGDQYNLLHVKDIDIREEHTTAIGQGDIPWNNIIDAVVYNNIEWILVEDNTPEAHNRDDYQSVQTSINYLNELFITRGLAHPE